MEGAGHPIKFPDLIAEVARNHPDAERIEIWFLDSARVGQTGRVCRRWFEKGMRPRGVRDLRHEAVYLFGAVCPVGCLSGSTSVVARSADRRRRRAGPAHG